VEKESCFGFPISQNITSVKKSAPAMADLLLSLTAGFKQLVFTFYFKTFQP
jgi:hypothetical protein